MVTEVSKWREATNILKNHKFNTIQQGRKLIPNKDDWMKDASVRKMKWASSEYEITKDMYEE